MPSPVSILDLPEPRFTTRNRARRFIRDGRAEWIEINVSIRFVPSHHAHKSAQVSEHEMLMGRTAYAYDRIGRPLTRQELRGIPFVGDVQRLMLVTR